MKMYYVVYGFYACTIYMEEEVDATKKKRSGKLGRHGRKKENYQSV